MAVSRGDGSARHGHNLQSFSEPLVVALSRYLEHGHCGLCGAGVRSNFQRKRQECTLRHRSSACSTRRRGRPIYYTTDGTTPGITSLRYTGPNHGLGNGDDQGGRRSKRLHREFCFFGRLLDCSTRCGADLTRLPKEPTLRCRRFRSPTQHRGRKSTSPPTGPRRRQTRCPTRVRSRSRQQRRSRAVAIASGYSLSPVASADYTINLANPAPVITSTSPAYSVAWGLCLHVDREWATVLLPAQRSIGAAPHCQPNS